MGCLVKTWVRPGGCASVGLGPRAGRDRSQN